MTRLNIFYLGFLTWLLLMFIFGPYVESTVRILILALTTVVYGIVCLITALEPAARRGLQKLLGDLDE